MVQVIVLSITLRALLIVSAFLLLLFVLRKLRKSQLEIQDSLFWLVFALVLVIVSIVPHIAFFAASFFGFESPSNFVFLCVIAALILRLFSLTSQVSVLKGRLESLAQEIALRELRNKKDDK